MKRPYKNWTKEELFWHLKRQVISYKCYEPDMLYLIKAAVYDERWNPLTQFNGCNLVQDDLHPFLPCFIHDWRWVTRQNILEADKEFRNNLIKFGYNKFKANLYFYGVRIGYIFYYHFKHKKK